MARAREDLIKAELLLAGSEVKGYALNGNRSVQDLFDAADFEYDGVRKIKVNGKAADLDTELENGDIVSVIGKIEGGLN